MSPPYVAWACHFIYHWALLLYLKSIIFSGQGPIQVAAETVTAAKSFIKVSPGMACTFYRLK